MIDQTWCETCKDYGPCEHIPSTEVVQEPNKLCPKCGKELWGLEYSYPHPEEYDGISEWFCNSDPEGLPKVKESHYRIGRWTGKELHGDEVEKRFGRTS